MKKPHPIVLASIILFSLASPAFASSTASTGGAALPWEGGLSKIAASLTGPVAITISILAIFAAAAALIWGGEIGEVTRKLCWVVIIVTILTNAAAFVTLISGSGALLS